MADKKKAKDIARQIEQQSQSVFQKAESFLSSHFKFRYNVVLDKLEATMINKNDYRNVTDYDFNSILRMMVNAGVDCKMSNLRQLLNSVYVPKYNPFIDYFTMLPEWDNKTDYIADLAATVKTTNDELWNYCFKKWIVAMLGGLIHDDVINHTVIVFSGKQGLGKTTWMLNLVPPQLKDYCFSGTINPDNKDSLVHLSECMLINLDELENLNRSELGSVKEMITKNSIRIRRPYGRCADTLIRRASFAGSVNGKEFLNDPTGSRRFLCFEVNEINYQHVVSLDEVYSQALHLYNSGFTYWFDKNEMGMVNSNNEQFRNTSIEEEMLMTYFEPCKAEEADFIMTTTEILRWLADRSKLIFSDASKKKLGMALRSCGFERVTKESRYMYALRTKDLIQAEYLNRIGPVPKIPSDEEIM